MAANAPILNAVEMDGYIYWATADKLHRTLLATITTVLVPTALNRQTFTAANSVAHPMLAANKYLYIGDGKYVAVYDSVTRDPIKLTLPSEEIVYQITLNGSIIRLYTRFLGNDS